MATIGS